MHNLHTKPKTLDDVEQIRVIVRKQLDQIMNSTGIIEGWVDCGICESAYPLWKLYRCYYCGIWICENCAPEHFGGERELMSRIDADAARE